jgi:hypothetical protein
LTAPATVRELRASLERWVAQARAAGLIAFAVWRTHRDG